MLIQTKNSVVLGIVGLANHYELVKELLGYLDFHSFGKENINKVYNVYKTMYQPGHGEKSRTNYLRR